MEKQIILKLLRWYAANKRDLPWRLKKEDNLPLPYYVFVSEYMLQQTTVPTVKTRFEEFIKIWPTLKDLAKTTEPKILKFWSGLGYYSRARNLLKAAKIIDKNLKSEIPKKYEDLIILPGVGDYTAKAILGIGYNASVIPLDANIERILARLYALNQPLIKVKKNLSEKAKLFLSKKYSSNLIQSFMDYGSIICIPRNPNCSICEIKKSINMLIKTKETTFPNMHNIIRCVGPKETPVQYRYFCIRKLNILTVYPRISLWKYFIHTAYLPLKTFKIKFTF